MRQYERYGAKRQDSYDAYHCPRCKDTGEEPRGLDPTLTERLRQMDPRCVSCEGMGVILVLAGHKPGRYHRYGKDLVRWPEKDINNA